MKPATASITYFSRCTQSVAGALRGKSNLEISATRRTFRVVAAGASLVGAFFGTSPAEARVPPNWDVSGQWLMHLSDGATVGLQLKQQTNGDITGTATRTGGDGTGGGIITRGISSGDGLSMIIVWAPTNITKKETRDGYEGRIYPRGQITGGCYPRMGNEVPSSSISWTTTTLMKRFQPASTGTGSGSGPKTSVPTTISAGATGSTSAPTTSSSADESSSSDSEDSSKKHKKKHKHRHQNEEDKENQDNS